MATQRTGRRRAGSERVVRDQGTRLPSATHRWPEPEWRQGRAPGRAGSRRRRRAPRPARACPGAQSGSASWRRHPGVRPPARRPGRWERRPADQGRGRRGGWCRHSRTPWCRMTPVAATPEPAATDASAHGTPGCVADARRPARPSRPMTTGWVPTGTGHRRLGPVEASAGSPPAALTGPGRCCAPQHGS